MASTRQRLRSTLESALRLTPLGWSLRRVERIAVSRLDVRPLERVLDLACGPRDALRLIASRGGIGVGVDLDPRALRTARAKVERRAHLVLAAPERLPFGEGTFDKAISVHAFYDFADQPAALRELHRVLRPGGLLVIAVPRADHPGARLAVEVVERRLLGREAARVHTLSTWRVMLAEAGFEVADVRPGPIFRPAAYAEAFVEATR